MNLITINNVRGFIDESGMAQLNLEDVSRGLGFTTVAASGNDVVRWSRVKEYLVDLKFLQEDAKDGLPEFIPENIFYRLSMKAKNETAENFQIKVADEILPSIRKTGSYQKPKSQAELMLMYAEQFVSMENRVVQMEETVTTIQDTLLNRDEDWRKSINTMLNRSAFKLGGQYRDLRKKSYEILEERAHCNLNQRLRNVLDRLEQSGATKTTINNASKLDVIENDVRLKEIYTTIVKELSIGSLKISG